MKTYTLTLTSAQGVPVTHEIRGKRAAREKLRQLRFANNLNVGTVISLPVPDDGFTEIHTNVGGSTVWAWTTTPLEKPTRAVRAGRTPKADLDELYRLTQRRTLVALGLTGLTGVDCSELDFSHAELPWQRSDGPSVTPRLRFFTGGEVSFTCFPDRFVERDGWVLAVRGGSLVYALRVAHEIPPAPPMPRQTDDQTTTDDQKEEA